MMPGAESPPRAMEQGAPSTADAQKLSFAQGMSDKLYEQLNNKLVPVSDSDRLLTVNSANRHPLSARAGAGKDQRASEPYLRMSNVGPRCGHAQPGLARSGARGRCAAGALILCDVHSHARMMHARAHAANSSAWNK